EFAPDRVDRGGDPVVGRRKEADERYEQHAGVEFRGAVVLRERATDRVVSTFADLVVDLVAGPLPPLERSVEPESLRKPDGAIEDDPGHHLGLREISPGTACFP